MKNVSSVVLARFFGSVVSFEAEIKAAFFFADSYEPASISCKNTSEASPVVMSE